jgi:hypothetical protein
MFVYFLNSVHVSVLKNIALLASWKDFKFWHLWHFWQHDIKSHSHNIWFSWRKTIKYLKRSGNTSRLLFKIASFFVVIIQIISFMITEKFLIFSLNKKEVFNWESKNIKLKHWEDDLRTDKKRKAFDQQM